MNKNQDLREKIDYNLLLNYMSHVSTLEKERYELHILYEALDQQHKRLNRENRKVRQKLVMKPNHEFVAGSAVLAVVTAIIGFIVLYFFADSYVDSILYSLEIWAAACAVFIVLLPLGGILAASRDSALKKKIDDKTNQMAIIKSEREKIDALYQETRNTLERFYHLNIVSVKHRNMVSIFTLYDYLLSKKCYRLEGPNGAYHLYESALRQGVIRENQKLLSQVIHESNQRAKELLLQMEDVAQRLDAISQNIKISAYYNNISAQNAESLTWLNLLNTRIH